MGLFWDYLGLFGIFGIFQDFLGFFGIFGIVGIFVTFGIFWDYLGLFGIYWDLLGFFWDFWDFWDFLGFEAKCRGFFSSYLPLGPNDGVMSHVKNPRICSLTQGEYCGVNATTQPLIFEIDHFPGTLFRYSNPKNLSVI